MDFKIRISNTPSGKNAVQIITYHNRKVIIHKHIGSTSSESELIILKEKAKAWVTDQMDTKGLFQKEDSFYELYEYQGFLYTYAYEFLTKIMNLFSFTFNQLFIDLIIARILEPSSKRKSVHFLSTFLDINHSENVLYKAITKYDNSLKESTEKSIITIAKNHFGFDFSFVLYDVTTLYFESFTSDEFKKLGFSKEHKHNQPQVVIGLITTETGFPISYEVFKGNTFEGKTFIPLLADFKKRHGIDTLTVVADSAMLSKQNIGDLEKENLNYIIAGRLNNMNQVILNQVDTELKKENRATLRINNLIVEYSSKRYTKDKKELDKYIEKAKAKLNLKTKKISPIRYLKMKK